MASMSLAETYSPEQAWALTAAGTCSLEMASVLTAEAMYSPEMVSESRAAEMCSADSLASACRASARPQYSPAVQLGFAHHAWAAPHRQPVQHCYHLPVQRHYHPPARPHRRRPASVPRPMHSTPTRHSPPAMHFAYA